MTTTRTIALMTLASTLAAASGLACSSSSSSNPADGGATDAGQDTATAADTGTTVDSGTSMPDSGTSTPDSGSITRDDAGCIEVVNDGPLVQQQNVASDPPTPMGGPLGDGTYYLTASTIYTGLDGGSGATSNSSQSTSQVSGGGTMYALVNGVGSAASYTNGTIAVSGANVTITPTCPSGGSVSTFDRFDSNGTVVTLYTSTTPVNALTYTKQ